MRPKKIITSRGECQHKDSNLLENKVILSKKDFLIEGGHANKYLTTAIGVLYNVSMRTAKNLVGLPFGKLRVVSRVGTNKKGSPTWLCECECGNFKVASTATLGSYTRSCGCLKTSLYKGSLGPALKKQKKNRMRSDGKPVGTTHGLLKDNRSTYTSWMSMKQRCYNPKQTAYKNYGGRGITVCTAWIGDFAQFFADMGPRPVGTSLGRKDNNLGYFQGNCSWDTPTVQANNTRATRRSGINKADTEEIARRQEQSQRFIMQQTRRSKPGKDIKFLKNLLEEIGSRYHGMLTDLARVYGVSRERMRQVMKKVDAEYAAEISALRSAAVARITGIPDKGIVVRPVPLRVLTQSREYRKKVAQLATA